MSFSNNSNNNSNNNHGGQFSNQQQQQQQQHPPQQMQLFMNPQTENLQQLYTLINDLMVHIEQNKKQKALVLHKIDTLSNHLNRDPEKMKESYQKDIVEFDNFLKGKVGTYTMKVNNLGKHQKVEMRKDGSDTSSIEVLKRQNLQLKELLKQEQGDTLQSFNVLGIHEEGIHRIIKALRCDIIDHKKRVHDIVSNKFQNEVVPKEDMEFEAYMENMEDFQKYLKISELCRTLLRTLNT